MLGLEAWSFELSTLLASYLGTISLDAHAIMLNIIAFTFISCPLAISIASSIRIGHLLGAGDAANAKTAARLTVGVTVVFMATLSLLKIFFR